MELTVRLNRVEIRALLEQPAVRDPSPYEPWASALRSAGGKLQAALDGTRDGDQPHTPRRSMR